MSVLVKAAAAPPLSVDEAKKHLEIPAAVSNHDAHLRRLILAATEKCEGYSRVALHLQTRRLTLRRFPCWEQLLPRPPLLGISSITYVDSDGVTQTLSSSLYRVATDHRPGFVEPAYNQTWPSIRDVSEAVKFEFYCGHGIEFTADADADTLTPDDQRFQNGDRITLSNYGGALPAGLSAGTSYYVINAGTTIQLAETEGGTAVDITGTGTGTHLIDAAPAVAREAIALCLSSWFNNREAAVTGTIATEIPMNARWLLDGLKRSLWPGTYGYSAMRAGA